MEYCLKKLSLLLNIDIYAEINNEFISFKDNSERNPLFKSKKLRSELKKSAMLQSKPYIYKDEFQVHFVCIKRNDEFYFTGPISLHALEKVELFEFYRKYGMSEEQAKPLKVFYFAEFLDFVELLNNLLNNVELDDKSLLEGNKSINDEEKTEKISSLLFEKKLEEDMIYKYTYQEGRNLLDCVRAGRTMDALRYTRNMDDNMEKSGEKNIDYWKNVMIVEITLCANAALEGGVSPYVAYQLGDYYVQKSKKSYNLDSILRYRNSAVEILTEEVRKEHERKCSSTHIEQCKNYVQKHYMEKIYLEDIAHKLGISPNYLSRIFNKETGMKLQDYITNVRVEKAANMLAYSSESIADIAKYVNFPTQSYLGKVFKDIKGVTPKKYREMHKLKESW